MLSERPITEENTSPKHDTANINSDLISIGSAENIICGKEYEETNSLGVR